MRIVHVIEGLVQTGGTSVFCVEVASAQAKKGDDVTLFYSTEVLYPVGSSIKVVRGDSLGELGFRPDLVHVHAVLSFFAVRCMKWCRQHHVPYIVSPHGGLMPRVFEHGTIKKRLFFALFLRRNLSCATAIHCTGESEQEAVRELGVTCGRAFVAPLGAYLPEFEESEKSIKRRRILFLSRLGEEKGLKLLLEAWDSIEHNSWHLIIAGPDWKNYRKQLEEMISRRKIQDVSLPGLVIGSAKDKIYREADIFILPSPMENFSMVVLDALAYGLPVICTQGTPWESISEAKCGWWISANSVKALIDALKEAMSLDDAVYRQMSLRARRLAARYSWDEVLKVVFREYKTAMQEQWRSKEHV